jgi:type I restriction enzyme S subunit
VTDELPDGWTRIPLREVGTWYGGGTPSKSNESYWNDGTIPWLSPKDMGTDTIAATEDHITTAAVENSSVKLVPSESIAIVVRSGILERTLPIGLVPFETTLNQDMKAVVAYDGIEPRWIAWAVRAHEHMVLRDCRKRGTTVASLDTVRLLDFEIPLAPPDDQRRILAALDEQLSRLDAAQACLTAGGARTRLAEASLLDAAVAGRLTPARTESPADLLEAIAQRRQQLTQKPALSPRQIAFALPKNWDIASLDALSWSAGYGTSTKCDYEGSGIPVLRIPNIQDGKVESSDIKYAVDQNVDLTEMLVTPGDILFVRTNGSRDLIGRAAVADGDLRAAFASYLIRFRLVRDGVDPKWVQTVVSSPTWRRYLTSNASSSAGQHNLNLKILGSLPIPVPAVTCQQEILDEIEVRRSRLRRIGRSATDAAAKASALRRSLLGAAFSGRLVPQCLSDYSASALLDRIRASHSMQQAPCRNVANLKEESAGRSAPSKTKPVPAGIQEELPL